MPRAMMSRSNTDVRHRFFCRRRIVDTREAWSRHASDSLHPDQTQTAGLGSRGKSLVVCRHHKIGGGLFPAQQYGRKMQRIQGAESGRERL
jgi:hypothetical protein